MVTTRGGGDRTTGAGPAVAVLLELVDEGFDRRSWHGTNLRGALRGLPPARAVWRPGRERHNIWEIVTHAAYWKYAVRRRLTGEKRGSFTLPGSDFFPAPKRGTQTAWRDNVALLTSEHRLLRAAVAKLEGRGRQAGGPRPGAPGWARSGHRRGTGARYRRPRSVSRGPDSADQTADALSERRHLCDVGTWRG